MVGILDEVEEKDGIYYPVEYKKGSKEENINDDVQLCCQAFLLEESMDIEIEKGYIYYGASFDRREVYFTQELRELTIDTISNAHKIMEDKIIPPPLNNYKCDGCSLINRCLPQEVAHINHQEQITRKPLPSTNLGRILYIDNPRMVLRKKGGRIIVEENDEKIKDIPIVAIDQVILMGPVQMSSQLIHEFLKRNIPVHFNTKYGKSLGWLNPVFSKNSLLRIKQIQNVDISTKQCKLARAFVKGKLKNIRTLLMRHNRELDSNEIAKIIDQLKGIMKKVDYIDEIDQLRGYEGLGSKLYFSVFNQLIKGDHEILKFNKRVRRPPKDPVNSMLSYGYSLLSNEVLNELTRVGLDPYVGYYHSNVYGRPALALDLMEEFRHIIVDSVVLMMLNKQMITMKDFDMKLNRCFLNEKGRKKFVKAFRSRVAEEIKHPIFEYKLTYRRVIELQARFLGKVITGEIEEYIPFFVR